ncbi:MAG: methyltransferase domain-containing protein [Rhodoglobus sp.]
MPYSAPEGKATAAAWVADLAPKTVLDVGPGSGTYVKLLRTDGSYWSCLEVHEPYVSRFLLWDWYDDVIVGDARDPNAWPVGGVDLVILGDVLEHFTKADALAVWALARAHSRHVLLSLPIIEWEQGECEDNPHEAHLHVWDHEQVLDLPGITATGLGEVIGVYLADGQRP